MFLAIMDEVGKIVNQSNMYNLIETILVVGALLFVGYVVYLALEKDEK